jgi:hypothetical protein
MRSARVLVAGDVAALVAFGLIGLASHEKSGGLEVIARSILPFVIAGSPSAVRLAYSAPAREGRMDRGCSCLARRRDRGHGWRRSSLTGAIHGLRHRDRRFWPVSGAWRWRTIDLCEELVAAPNRHRQWEYMDKVAGIIINLTAVAVVGGLIAMLVAIILMI